MINFQIDYAEGAHPTIMSALMQTNMLQTPGYGTDYYCQQAKEYIQTYLNPTKCDIHFLMGGTQTNLTFISHVLRPYEAVLSPSTGHIAFNETGSIAESYWLQTRVVSGLCVSSVLSFDNSA